MSLVSLDFSLDSFPDVQVREGQIVRGFVRGGKLHVTISVQDEADTIPGASLVFLRKWSGQGRLLAAYEMANDRRLADLTAKHVR